MKSFLNSLSIFVPRNPLVVDENFVRRLGLIGNVDRLIATFSVWRVERLLVVLLSAFLFCPQIVFPTVLVYIVGLPVVSFILVLISYALRHTRQSLFWHRTGSLRRFHRLDRIGLRSRVGLRNRLWLGFRRRCRRRNRLGLRRRFRRQFWLGNRFRNRRLSRFVYVLPRVGEIGFFRQIVYFGDRKVTGSFFVAFDAARFFTPLSNTDRIEP